MKSGRVAPVAWLSEAGSPANPKKLERVFMHWNQLETHWKQLKGSINQKWGKLTIMTSNILPANATSSRASCRAVWIV
jgi:hypothetical protein